MSFDITTDPNDPSIMHVDFWAKMDLPVEYIKVDMLLQSRNMTWREYFDSLKQESFTKNPSVSKQIYEQMQERYPGPYTVQQYYSPKRGCLDYQLVFADPKQETLWMIKHT